MGSATDTVGRLHLVFIGEVVARHLAQIYPRFVVRVPRLLKLCFNLKFGNEGV